MRCQRVRSFLSAYCKEELSERRQRAVHEHLQRCSECRREEALYNELNDATAKLPQYHVSDDFNKNLLNRVAQEHFKETRSKAYMPKRAPIFGWGRLIPAVASISLVLALFFAGGFGLLKNQPEQNMTIADKSQESNVLDDRYKYVQPESDHVLNYHARSEWAFKKQVARANRIRDLMNTLASQTDLNRNVTHFATSQSMPINQGIFINIPLDGRTMNRTYNILPAVNTANDIR